MFKRGDKVWCYLLSGKHLISGTITMVYGNNCHVKFDNVVCNRRGDFYNFDELILT